MAKKYKRKRIESPKKFDPESFRVITLSKKKGIKGIIGCPLGYYDPVTEQCLVGTRLQAKLKPIPSNPRVPVSKILGKRKLKKIRPVYYESRDILGKRKYYRTPYKKIVEINPKIKVGKIKYIVYQRADDKKLYYHKFKKMPSLYYLPEIREIRFKTKFSLSEGFKG